MSHFACPSTPNSSVTSQRGWQRGIEVGLVFLVFLAFGGDPAPHLNEPHYLCRFKHYWQPDWAAGDLFLESPDAHFVVVVAFGWLTKFLSLAATAWTLRVAVWLALAWAWQRLSYRLVPHNWCAPLAAALWTFAIEQGNLAGEWVIGGFEAKCVAYVFVLLALRDLVDNRWNRVWFLLGWASAFHVLVGGWSVIVSLFVWAILRRGGFDGRARLLPSPGLETGFGSAGASPSHRGWGQSAAQPPAEVQSSFADTSRPPPLHSMLPGLVAGGAIALLGLIPTLALNWGTPPETVAEANYIYTFIRLPHHLALLHMDQAWLLERAGRHAVVLAIWTLLAWRLWRYRPESAHGPFGRMILFAAGALALAVCGLAIELIFWRHPSTAANLQRFYWYRLNDITAAAVAAWLVVDWIVEQFVKRRPLAVVLLTVAVGIVGVRLAWISYARSVFPLAPADRQMRDYAEWLDVCQWVNDNTPAKAKFLVPRMSHTFKWRTGRPEVVTRKDIPQDAANLVRWHQRMQEVFPISTQEWPPASPVDPESARIADLAQKYSTDFLITDMRQYLSFPVLYENEAYKVYDLNARRRSTPADSTTNAVDH